MPAALEVALNGSIFSSQMDFFTTCAALFRLVHGLIFLWGIVPPDRSSNKRYELRVPATLNYYWNFTHIIACA